MNPKFIYIIPAFNEELVLRSKVEKILSVARDSEIKALVIVENGSTDSTGSIADALTKSPNPVPIYVFHLKNADSGEAWARGLTETLLLYPNENYFYLLTAADLPFEFSDLNEFKKAYQENSSLDLVIGSKAHPQSVLRLAILRRLMTRVFFFLRFLFLGLRIKDTQGTIFLRGTRAKEILDLTSARGFFFSTELVFRAHQQKLRICEVPVVLRADERKSTVKIGRDSFKMLMELLKLAFLRW